MVDGLPGKFDYVQFARLYLKTDANHIPSLKLAVRDVLSVEERIAFLKRCISRFPAEGHFHMMLGCLYGFKNRSTVIHGF